MALSKREKRFLDREEALRKRGLALINREREVLRFLLKRALRRGEYPVQEIHREEKKKRIIKEARKQWKSGSFKTKREAVDFARIIVEH